jgi:hypothetical protein
MDTKMTPSRKGDSDKTRVEVVDARLYYMQDHLLEVPDEEDPRT